MIQTESRQAKQQQQNLTQGFETPQYQNESLLAAILQKEQGGLVFDNQAKKPKLLIYARLNTLGWYYLVEMPAKAGQL